MTYILGISAYYHDSAACLIHDGDIVAAAQEERYSRRKHDSKFPSQSIQYCLKEAGIDLGLVDFIGFYDKPFVKFERLLETYLAEAPRGFTSFSLAMPLWLREKLFLKETLLSELIKIQIPTVKNKRKIKATRSEIEEKLLFGEHHGSHASSCYYPSPFNEAAILTMDGVGEWVTTSIAHGKEGRIKFIKDILFPHSLGLLYSAITYFLGFKVNSGEYKVMGLAPYGKPEYAHLIKENLIDIKSDGSYRLNMDYFDYTSGLRMTNKKFNTLFGKSPREPESPLTQFDMDLASSLQIVTEEVVIKLARTAKTITNSKNLVMSGGVALNCVANGKLKKANIFDNIWLQPASGDAGGSLGVAFSIYFQHLKNTRCKKKRGDQMKGAYLGNKYSDMEIQKYLDSVGANYLKVTSQEKFNQMLVECIKRGNVIGWHQGRMEFGPRALGARSIIGDARSPEMQTRINLKIKYRESFRPFAPAVLRERLTDYFDIDDMDSPYMLMVAPIKNEIRIPMKASQIKLSGIDKLNVVRSQFPAVTHVDYSARIQTVHHDTNPKFYNLLKEFERQTGDGILVNTSFNIRGEPIVCSPEDSFKCFMRTEMDILAIENFILRKEDQRITF